MEVLKIGFPNILLGKLKTLLSVQRLLWCKCSARLHILVAYGSEQKGTSAEDVVCETHHWKTPLLAELAKGLGSNTLDRLEWVVDECHNPGCQY